MDAASFHKARKYAETRSGRIAYFEQGAGPPALFLHGVPLNGYHWRHVFARISDIRRCIAIDLLGLGYSEVRPGQDLSFNAQARMAVEVLDFLNIDRFDLVGNDSGGAIAQIVAANNSERVRTLTLTNCDVHDMWPPAAVMPTVAAARSGKLAQRFREMVEDPERARNERGLGIAFSEPGKLSDEAVRVYLEPLLASQERIDAMHRYWIAFDNAQTVAIEPLLKQLHVPTLIVWGTDDVFFHRDQGRWLRDTIPGVERYIEEAQARLFFPEDRPDALAGPLREHWERNGE